LRGIFEPTLKFVSAFGNSQTNSYNIGLQQELSSANCDYEAEVIDSEYSDDLDEANALWTLPFDDKIATRLCPFRLSASPESIRITSGLNLDAITAELCSVVLEANPSDIQLRKTRAKSVLEVQHGNGSDVAIRDLTFCLENGLQNDPEVYDLRGKAHHFVQSYEKAVRDFTVVIEHFGLGV